MKGKIIENYSDGTWTGYIAKHKHGYSAVMEEGFETFDTLEEAQNCMKENGYEKVNK